MSDMSSAESYERVCYLQKAADNFRKIGLMRGDRTWDRMAKSLEGILKEARIIYHSKSMPRAEALKIVDAMERKLRAKEEAGQVH